MTTLTALVLAGGKGERLRPYTENLPKPMVEVGDKPLLHWHLDWLRDNGVGRVFLLCGYRHQAIQDYFGDGAPVGLEVRYVVEDEPLGRGGAIKQGLASIPDDADPVLASNGDIITDQPLAPLLEAHVRQGGLATIMLVPLVSPYGIVTVRGDDSVSEFLEKPVLPHLVNGGVYVMSRAIRERLPDKGDHETETFPRLAEERRLFAFKSSALWLPVDTVKDLGEAAKMLAGRG